MIRAFEVTPQANDDLQDIADYTLAHWGAAQMARYMGEINNRFEWLSENPDVGQRRDALRPDLRSFKQGSHMIFYRPRDGYIDIVTVIHQSSDLQANLKDRL